MSDTQYRIPRLATAVMVLGANGCGDDGGGGESVDSRLSDIATQTCKLVYSCKDGPFAPKSGDELSFTTEQECVRQFQAAIKAPLTQSSAKCQDAFLDYYDCYLSDGCTADTQTKCAKLYQTYYEACDGEPLTTKQSP